MKRALLTILGVALLAGLVSYVTTHPNLEQADRLESELVKLRSENEKLATENEQLEAKVQALRDDPRLAERRAREAGGLARPGEVIFQFEEPREPIEVDVKLVVHDDDEAELAGKKMATGDLPDALKELKRQVPGASLSVKWGEDIDAIGRQRVLDIIEASPLGKTPDVSN